MGEKAIEILSPREREYATKEELEQLKNAGKIAFETVKRAENENDGNYTLRLLDAVRDKQEEIINTIRNRYAEKTGANIDQILKDVKADLQTLSKKKFTAHNKTIKADIKNQGIAISDELLEKLEDNPTNYKNYCLSNMYIYFHATTYHKLDDKVINDAVDKHVASKWQQPLNTPENFYSPKDSVSNYLMDNRLEGNKYTFINTLGKKFGGVMARIDYKEPEQCKYVKVNYKELEQDEYVKAYIKKLTPTDRTYHDAVCSWCAENAAIYDSIIVTAQQINIVASQNPNAKLTPKRQIEIAEFMQKAKRIEAIILTDNSEQPALWEKVKASKGNKNLTPERQEKGYTKNLMPRYSGDLIPHDVLAYDTIKHPKTGKQINVPSEYIILRAPILYLYAAAKGQVASTPIRQLDTSLKSLPAGDIGDKVISRTTKTNSIVNLLMREIDTMKKTKGYSRIISLKRIYQIDGIDDVQQDPNTIKQKKSQTRQKLTRLLKRLEANGTIKGYQYRDRKQGRNRCIYGVEVIL